MPDVKEFNARWLKAWSDKDVDGLAAMYAPDTAYFDPQVPDGLSGRDALKAYLTKLFAETPPMHYEPHETWETHDGFCGRWYCTIDGGDGGDAGKSYLRGFDLVVMKDGLIARNEVYVHPIAQAA